MGEFKVGGKMLAIDKNPYQIHKYMKVYPTNGIKKGCTHYPVLIDSGVQPDNGYSICEYCNNQIEGSWWAAKIFIPLEIDESELSETTTEDILKEEVITEPEKV